MMVVGITFFTGGGKDGHRVPESSNLRLFVKADLDPSGCFTNKSGSSLQMSASVILHFKTPV